MFRARDNRARVRVKVRFNRAKIRVRARVNRVGVWFELGLGLG